MSWATVARYLTVYQGRGKLLVFFFFFLLQGFDRTMRLQVTKYREFYCNNNLKVAN